ncbi:aldose 1-epimerase family protein [Haliovirga abyssi]|uniref:LACX protein n=1 Tax=Haliovirga abyssi TaxID=2996794 RepID=A0AAU9DVD0_9FUSO|nr:aldose 1-epimerase family protein [Haliovirga abyssi]BDU50071.1 LACX protein [Haliovirga abyssi]
MEYKLSNGTVEIVVKSKGAELKSAKLIKNKTEFMWDANPKFWAKSSPVLFPFVGGLKDNKYFYKNKEYKSGRHGFARDNEFNIFAQDENSITFIFSSNEETLIKYPFEFDFFVKYVLEKNKIILEYKVINKTDGEIYFSLGGHPAFATPTSDEIKFEDYYLEFEKEETSKLLVLDGMYVSDKQLNYFNNEKIINLKRDMFDNDALIFEGLNSTKVSLKNKINNRKIVFDFEGFPFIAFWSAPGADYICIEPWHGIADTINHNGNIEEKKGIEKLEKGESFETSFSIELEA